METEYSVYEIHDEGQSYIGSVTATDKPNAIDIAHRKYGAPINVEA